MSWMQERSDERFDDYSGPCTLKPLEQSVVPCAPLGAMKSIGFLCGQPDDEHLPPPSTAVDRANRYLDAWKSMIGNQLREATDRWSEQIEVKRLSVGVTLLDGSHVWCLKRFKDTLTKARDVESRIVESIERWNGCWRSIALTNCRGPVTSCRFRLTNLLKRHRLGETWGCGIASFAFVDSRGNSTENR
ncbi:unnamed protein product [Porites evermanni]|uniref:Uncharacterized protein n=1 Tax=Porites evermanni TaxID=104178 RepID=A0ABN8R1H6_9CNID|nr:unnamed protein product [Porites evermanni]